MNMRLIHVSALLLVLSFYFVSIGTAQNFSYDTQIQYLSGIDKDHRVDWEFKIDKGRKGGTWTTIPVPSNWEFEGFGTYNYGHDWRDSLPKSDATGHYKHNFSVPPAWKGKIVEIVFEGVMTDTEVTVNGKKAGALHQGGFYRFKYDITKLIKVGKENLLEVKVNNMSSNESVNKAERDADFWVFGGIYRPVYLEAKPAQHIDRVAVDARMDGFFAVDVYLKNNQKSDVLEAQVFSLDGQPFGEAFQSQPIGNGDKYTLTHQFNNPKLWSPEFPNLYNVEIKLKRKNNEVHVIKQQFGFRTVELRSKDGFYVNGNKIKLKGVNRHSFWPSSGRTLSKELSIIDVNLMKDMNMNAVRMSHYPPDQHFLDVCDSLGLFVIDELTGWQSAYDTEVGRKLVKELVIRDVNHPSVIMWANGNEGGNNYELLADYPMYDPQNRTVIHPWNTLGETNTLHYSGLNYISDALSNGDKIYFPTEMIHGLYDGGHGAGLEDIWNVMQHSALSAGGFLWVFSDEGAVRTDQDGRVDVKDLYAPDGILGPYREKEASYYTIKEVWSPIFIDQPYITPEFDGKLKIENRFQFTNLEDCTLAWNLIAFPKPTDQRTDSTILDKGDIVLPSLLPGLSAYLDVQLPQNWQDADALHLTATDPHGRHILTWTWPIKTSSQFASAVVDTISQQRAIGREGTKYVHLEANGIKIKLDKENGLITGVENDLTPISFANGPKLTHEDSKFKAIHHYQEGNNYIVVVDYDGPINKLSYTMLGNGWLKLDYTYALNADYDCMGITFSYPEEKVKGVKWLGKGPYRVWKNRMKGPHFAVHQKQYNNTVTGMDWDYPEFKGYHDRMFWAVIDNEEYPITVVSETDHIFLRLFTPKPTGYKNVDPAFPDGDISFMDAISPIGTKFHRADQLSTQGSKNQFRNRRDRQRLFGATLYFNFGVDAGKNVHADKETLN